MTNKLVTFTRYSSDKPEPKAFDKQMETVGKWVAGKGFKTPCFIFEDSGAAVGETRSRTGRNSSK